MRLFVAVNPGEQFTGTLTTALDPWRSRLALNWTPPGQWHLTLQFLGEWPPERVSVLQGALNQGVDEPSFTIEPGGLATFGRSDQPRVLFLQLEGAGQAARLADRIRAVVAECWPEGPQDTKPFRGHLTVARIRKTLEPKQAKMLESLAVGDFPPWVVSGFSLMKSELGQGGARHEELAFYPLRKKGE